ncbi:rod shape-determining protein MreC [Nonomuraea sp. NPDC049486]|uniref:rod shape-determining protein MreC n=1 Tax=Nonomuraea sp. NPDC049486 TaxID=3155773 RepID=UPI00343132BA
MRDSRQARLILGTLLAAALVILTVDHRAGESSPLEPLRAAGSWVFGTAEQAGATVFGPVTGFVEALAGAPAAQESIARLRRENARLRADLAAGKVDTMRSAELKRMLGLASLGGYKVVPANVIARRGQPGFEEAVELDAGTDDGVRADMTVINGDGLVGRVVHASPRTSSVVLLSDPASAAGARLEQGREIGVVHGVGEHGRLLRFQLLDATAPVLRGSRLVSFGSHRGAPYVPGVPIGVVERVEPASGELTRTAYARPYADMTALDVVGVVVQPPARDPRDAVLPRREGTR